MNGINTVDATHQRVISLMSNAGRSGQVTLRVRRKIEEEGLYRVESILVRVLCVRECVRACMYSEHRTHSKFSYQYWLREIKIFSNLNEINVVFLVDQFSPST